jgi:protein TonB
MPIGNQKAMFDGADIYSDDIATGGSAVRKPVSRPMAEVFALPEGGSSVEPQAVPRETSRYGEGRRMNVTAIVGAAAIHVLLLAGLLFMKSDIIHDKLEKRLTVVDLTPPPPPPSQQTPPQAQPDIVAPRPPVRLVQAPKVATTPEPLPTSAPSAPTAAPVVTPSPAPVVAAQPAPPSTVKVSDLSARMISGSPPRYPMESRRKREEGTVVLSVVVGVDGRVANISVSRSSGHDRLDQAALSAVRKWRWQPFVDNGRAVEMKGMVDFPFKIEG